MTPNGAQAVIERLEAQRISVINFKCAVTELADERSRLIVVDARGYQRWIPIHAATRDTLMAEIARLEKSIQRAERRIGRWK